ncbi:MAG: SufD family Fe-S cluster assembly protein [Thermoproteota archaeon]|jgi:ABC-type transport system involved in Fe-S cluster assembly, permease component
MSEIINVSEKQIKEISYFLNEPSWHVEERLKAFKIYNSLPIEITPLYVKHFDITGMNLKDAKINFKNDAALPREVENLLQKLDYVPYVLFFNGKLQKINLPELLKKESLQIYDLSMIFGKEDLLKNVLKYKVINEEEDKFAALNNALADSGVFISIPPGLQLKVPLRIINLISEEELLSFLQYYIVLNNDTNVVIIEEDYSIGIENKQSLSSKNINVYLKEGAKLEYVYINGFEEAINNITFRRAICEKDANIAWYSGLFGGLVNRIKTDSRMYLQGSTSNNIEIVVGGKKQRFDLTSYLSHIATYTKSVSLTRGVLKEEARALFKGMIKIYENAKNSEAYLAEHAMILNKGARADSIPGLEIANNEVRATHSASVAQIDEEQIFYIMSRGLSESEAKKLLTVSFFQQIIDQMPIEEVKEKMLEFIEKKLDNIGIRLEDKFILTKEFRETTVITPEKLFETHYKYRK